MLTSHHLLTRCIAAHRQLLAPSRLLLLLAMPAEGSAADSQSIRLCARLGG